MSGGRIDVLIEITTAKKTDGKDVETHHLARGRIDTDSIEAIAADPEHAGYVRVYTRTGGYFLTKTEFETLDEKIWGPRYECS